MMHVVIQNIKTFEFNSEDLFFEDNDIIEKEQNHKVAFYDIKENSKLLDLKLNDND